eukprot:3052716-Pyramimonas_sp.AAC.1
MPSGIPGEHRMANMRRLVNGGACVSSAGTSPSAWRRMGCFGPPRFLPRAGVTESTFSGALHTPYVVREMVAS